MTRLMCIAILISILICFAWKQKSANKHSVDYNTFNEMISIGIFA